jgi:pectate lyase
MKSGAFRAITAAAASVLISSCSAHLKAAEVTAFPGAEGFGANATGGRGGDIVHVANLNDSGPGSLRDAVSKDNRIVVFDVGGYIHLKSGLHIASDITIAGQSAPGQGIGIADDFVSLSGSHNVIVRYLRLREGLGASRGKSSLMVTGGNEMIFDHLSVEWGRWDCVDINQCQDLTFQNCLIGQGIDPQRFGCLCQCDNVTFSHCLWVDNQSRNPKSKGHNIQFINNVVFNWGVTGYVGGHSEAGHAADMIGNYFIKGPSSLNNRFAGEFAPTDHIFQAGNMVDLNMDGQLNGKPVQSSTLGSGPRAPTLLTHSTMTAPVTTTIQSATEAYATVIATAGCSLQRDEADQRLINEVKSLGKRGRIINDPAEAGGFGQIKGGPPIIERGADPIPHAWKAAHGINPNDSKAYRRIDRDGRMVVEEFLDDLAARPAPGSK